MSFFFSTCSFTNIFSSSRLEVSEQSFKLSTDENEWFKIFVHLIIKYIFDNSENCYFEAISVY